jgi:hypothetical protein
MWDDFEQWLHRRIGFDLAAHHQLIADRANELAAVVADHFAEDEAALGIDVHLALPTITAKVLREHVKLERAGLSGNALAAVRGSYGGLLMFGMVGQMAGLALLNPFSVLIGIGLGRRGLREEKRRQLVQRQQQAKMTVRKYLDDINLEASKVSRRCDPARSPRAARRVRRPAPNSCRPRSVSRSAAPRPRPRRRWPIASNGCRRRSRSTSELRNPPPRRAARGRPRDVPGAQR